MATYYSGYSPTIDWSEIGRSDPVPGDADQIRTMAKEFRDTAAALQTAKDKLEQIKNDQSADSDAVTEFKSMSGDTGDSIYRAHGRYTTVASALETYAGELDDVQRRAVTALNTALQTKEDKASAERARDGLTVDQDEDGTQWAAADRKVTDLYEAEGTNDRALNAIHNEWLEAGIRAASAIDGSFDDGLTPDPWEKFWQMASEILDTLSTVLSIAALVLSWVPFLGQALAVLALVVAALNLITKLVLAIGYGGDVGDVVWAAVGIFGGALAKGASGLLKGGAMALRGTKLSGAASRASKGVAARTRAEFRSVSKGRRPGSTTGPGAAGEYGAAMRNPLRAMQEGFRKYGADFAKTRDAVKADGYWKTALNELDHGRGLLPGPFKDAVNINRLMKDPASLAELNKYMGNFGNWMHATNLSVQTVNWFRSATSMAENGPQLGSAPGSIADKWDSMMSDFAESEYNRG
mgnify:CR=1 FL=1